MTESKQKASFEKHFFEHLKETAGYTGVLGSGWLEGDEYRDVRKFLVIDENFKVTFEHQPFGKGGNWHPTVEAKRKEMGIDDESRSDRIRMRTDDSIDDLISSELTSAALNWSSSFWVNGKFSRDGFDIESNSPEFDELEKICSFMRNRLRTYSESRFDKDAVEYEKGNKNKIDACIQWFANNKSATPVQDAWMRLLRSRGVDVNWEPHVIPGINEVPVMKPVDYSSVDVLDAKREARTNAMRDKITPEMREELRAAANRLK